MKLRLLLFITAALGANTTAWAASIMWRAANGNWRINFYHESTIGFVGGWHELWLWSALALATGCLWAVSGVLLWREYVKLLQGRR